MPGLYGSIPANITLNPGQIARRKLDDTGWDAVRVPINGADINLGNVDNTSDTNKPISTATQTALDLKVNSTDLATVATSGSYNDLTNKPTIPAPQINSDWNATSGVAQILNKPTIPDTTGLRKVETFLGTTNASGNLTITFANSYSTPPDIQPQIIGGTFNQFLRIVSVSTTQAVIQVGQRNAVTLLGVEVLLASTVAVNGASVTVQVTPRS